MSRSPRTGRDQNFYHLLGVVHLFPSAAHQYLLGPIAHAGRDQSGVLVDPPLPLEGDHPEYLGELLLTEPRAASNEFSLGIVSIIDHHVAAEK